MTHNKTTPALWFQCEGGNMNTVTDYYKVIFANDLEIGTIMPLGETPSGSTELCHITLFGQKYLFMTTAMEHHPFNDAFSIMIHCGSQQEIDRYWNYFTEEGEESRCGWCMDKFGLRWQIIPQNLGELMQKPNAVQVMMKQTKIVIEEYLQ